MTTLARLKAISNGQQRRLSGFDLDKARILATRLKSEAERELRSIEREIRFLESKPATIRADWSLPLAPACPQCGLMMSQAAVFDCEELWLGWECDCGETQGVPTIEWPWEETYIWALDAQEAGFAVS